MGFISRALKQTATYWETATTAYDEFGDVQLEAPVTLDCRWEARDELFIAANGDQQHSRAIVYTLDEILTGGFLYLGESTETDPVTVTGADLIRRVEQSPDIRNRTTLYKSFL